MKKVEIIIPKIKSVKVEPVYVLARTHNVAEVTKVTFKDGKAITFSGHLSRKEATYQGYLQRAKDAGLTDQDAENFAAHQYPEPMQKGA